MKTYIYKFFVFVIFGLFVINTAQSTDVPKGIKLIKDGNGYIVSFENQGYKMNEIQANGETYLDLISNEYGVTPEAGLPKLPQITFCIMLGSNEKTPSFNIINQDREQLTLKNKIYPSQMPWEKSNRLEDRPFVINRAYYNSKGSIDNPMVKISEPFIMAGAKGVMVTIFPFAYDPSANQLQITKTASFKINLNEPAQLSITPSKSFNDLYQNVFLNYTSSKVTPTNRYLIITAPEFETALALFVTHKTNLRYNVTVVNTNVTGTTNAAIKTYIQNLYNNISTRPEFILLVGDVDKIPDWVGGGLETPHTDWNYALLEGNDLWVDAFLGRFPIQNTTQLANIINKTIYMETQINSLWKKNVFMASTDNHTISEGTHNAVIDSFYIPHGFTVNTKLYSYYGATTAQVSASVDSGKIFAIYSGHGAETYWADGPVFNQSNVNALNNTIYPFVYSYACLTGSYYISSECFAETWIRSPKAGVVFWGASVTSYWDEDDILERKVAKSLFTDNLKKNSPNEVQGKIYTVQYFGSITPTMQRYMEMYNCMGDPSIYQVSYCPSISHTRLPDTENLTGPYAVNCVVTPEGSSIVSTKLFWTRATVFDSISMTNTSGNNWTANIPGNGSPSVYKYYLKTTDSANLTSSLPAGAPASYFTFTASVDTVKPVIVHAPIGATPKSYWPLSLSANVTDNIGIDSVWVEWYKNTPNPVKRFKLNLSGGSNYSAVFNSLASDVNIGDVIYYVVRTKDCSGNHNPAQLPVSGYYSFGIINLRLCQGFWNSAFPPDGWTITGSGNTYWSRNDVSSFGNGTGSARFNYYSASSGTVASLVSLQFDPSSVGDSLKFDVAHAYYSTTYIDTLRIEASTNGGTTYSTLATLWSNTNFTDPNSLSTANTTSLFVPTSAQWKIKKYLLPTGTNKVRFTAISGYGNDMFLDSIFQITGPTGITNNGNTIPQVYSLSQNYPNPFNPVTKINFAIPKQSMTILKIYDVLGREVMKLVNEVKLPGEYSVTFDGSNLSSGVYFYKLESGTFNDVKRMMLIK